MLYLINIFKSLMQLPSTIFENNMDYMDAKATPTLLGWRAIHGDRNEFHQLKDVDRSFLIYAHIFIFISKFTYWLH